MNFTFWSSAGQRLKQGGATDTFESIETDAGPLVRNIEMNFKQGDRIDEMMFRALPLKIQEKLTREGEGYEFNTDEQLLAHALPEAKYTELLGGLFNDMVPTVRVSKENAPESVKQRLAHDYNKRELDDNDPEVIFFFDDTVNESVGLIYDKAQLAKAKATNADAITGKTDGVSVVAAKV